MKHTSLFVAAGLGLAATTANATLIAGWNMSSVPDIPTGLNTFEANFSELYAGAGTANNSPAGTLFANGQFGSGDGAGNPVTNESAFTFVAAFGDSAFNADTPGPGTDEMLETNIQGDPSAGNVFLNVADGTFGGGGTQDPSGDYLVFAAFAPGGTWFSGAYTISYAIGDTGMNSTDVILSTSLNGTDYTDVDTHIITGADELGTEFSLTASSQETAIFFRMQVPDVGFGSMALDNVQINGPTPVPEPATVASILGLLALSLGIYHRRRK